MLLRSPSQNQVSQVVITGQVIITSEESAPELWPEEIPLCLFLTLSCSSRRLRSLEDKLVFSVGTDSMIHAVSYIIKVWELKMSKPGC